MLDTIRIVETPEGVELKLTCVSFFARSIAWLLDALFQAVFFIAFLLVLPRFGDFGTGLMLIVLFFMQWLYPVFFEIYMKGQTPGKKIMKIQVLLIDGTMVNWGASLLRNLLRTVDFLPSLYALGLLTMFISRDFRRLGDLAANTIVVYKREIKEKIVIDAAEPYAPEVILSGTEQQMLVNFAERLHDFSPERAEELASLATPLLTQLPTPEQVVSAQQKDKLQPASYRILGIANYLMGHR